MGALIRKLANAHFEITGEHVYSGRDADGRHMFSDVTIWDEHRALLHMLMILNRGVGDEISREERNYRD